MNRLGLPGAVELEVTPPIWDAEAAREQLLLLLLALAGPFVAALERARSGALALGQEVSFGPIRLHNAADAPAPFP